ncbi:MAG: RDD family protein [Chloroflexi bacterium]|nr:RDD family protein [Chloroflexota bacterium]
MSLLRLVGGPVYYVLMTGLRGQTLGKMALGIKVVDERGQVPGVGRAALREVIGKFLSALALGLGFLWIAWDGKKQGWHDKIATTFVVRALR